MALLIKYLPVPRHIPYEPCVESIKYSIAARTCRPYGNRENWVPRNVSDFGDGGAFPEIQVVQYPLYMGSRTGQKSNVIATQLDAENNIKYDAIARQGHSKNKIVYSKFTDLLPSEVTNDFHRPSQEEIENVTHKTRLALEKITNAKIKAALPACAADKPGPSQFIRYTPAQQGEGFNSGAKQRIIRMVEVQTDPMEPPRFKINQKIPRGPPSPPAPVLHSPTRKATVKEQQEWKIPPCVSNWKNIKGYTIPLDKRLAADGRGLQQVHINEQFAKLAESLFIADRKARESVELRSQLEKKQAQKEREKKEDSLRRFAQQWRNERSGLKVGSDEDDEQASERDELRHDRNRNRRRERNVARADGDKRPNIVRQRERDISEQIALGMPARNHGELLYDQRLLNQTRGMDSGFADDEAYTVYDKPWRQSGTLSENLYRPSRDLDQDLYGNDLEKLVKTRKFVPHHDFRGTDRAATGGCTEPVQFEKEEDPFGVDKFLTEARQARPSRKRSVDAERPDQNKNDNKLQRRD